MDILNEINDAIRYIQSKCATKPIAGIVLGSGLGSFVDEIDIECEISYNDIPHFPVSTVKGHKSKMIFGNIGGKNIVAMAGRFHYYEGYSTAEVVFPIRVLKFLGIQTLLLSNAAGGINPDLKVGDLMIIRDHISFLTINPLIGKNEDVFGERFPYMSEPYKNDLILKAKKIATLENIAIKEGVYVGVTGPSFETRSEYKMLHILGGDAVGMSTVQEVIAARHMHMNVFAMSVITDLWTRDHNIKITHDEVLHYAKAAEPKLAAIFKELIAVL